MHDLLLCLYSRAQGLTCSAMDLLNVDLQEQSTHASKMTTLRMALCAAAGHVIHHNHMLFLLTIVP